MCIRDRYCLMFDYIIVLTAVMLGEVVHTLDLIEVKLVNMLILVKRMNVHR